MKNLRRMFALLLCVLLAVCFLGCQSAPVETTPPTTEPAPTDPPPTAQEIYAAACDLLDTAKVTLDVLTTTTTTVADQEFSVVTKDILTYNNYGSDAFQSSVTRSITTADRDPNVAIEDSSIAYSEVYSDGVIYISSQGGSYRFSAALTDEETVTRYAPAALLNAALYADLTVETSGSGSTVTFASPSAPEAWAIPEGAKMLDASGSVMLDAAGALKKMVYTVTYEYGNATITKEVESKPRADALSVVVPQNGADYLMLQDSDALLRYINGIVMSWQTNAATTTSSESIFSAAAMTMRSEGLSLQLHEDEEVSFKADTDISLVSYSTGETQTYKQVETYLDGKYVMTVDGGVPTSETGLTGDVFVDYSLDILLANMVVPDYWLDVTTTDLGSLYLMEFTCSDDLGDSTQNMICQTFWGDAAFLNKLASDYVTNSVTAYMAFDKYTGLPTAAGYAYAGTHTIDGQAYQLTYQADQSLNLSALDAYYTISEKMLPEEEPVQKATPLFYHVTGEEGQEMWLFGTIHVGDERTAYLPQKIYDAFSASDALALEFDTEAFEKQLEEDDALQAQVAALYIYADGTTLSDHLSEETMELLPKYLKATGNFNTTYSVMKPSILSTSIENFYLAQGYQLTSMQGCEKRLTALAKQQEKKILDVESGLFQTEMMANWSDELQEILLEEALEYTAESYWLETAKLYDLWCAGDEAALRKELSFEAQLEALTDEERAEYETQKPYIDEYNQTMSYDRNDGMLEVAKEYLESGDTVFFAVGLAHLLDDVNGLVDALRDAGYTVELVSYT